MKTKVEKNFELCGSIHQFSRATSDAFTDLPSVLLKNTCKDSSSEFSKSEKAAVTEKLQQLSASSTLAATAAFCGVCSTSAEVAFETRDDQVSHYQSDFHRFNLKRKLANKPPICEDEFEERFSDGKKYCTS